MQSKYTQGAKQWINSSYCHACNNKNVISGLSPEGKQLMMCTNTNTTDCISANTDSVLIFSPPGGRWEWWRASTAAKTRLFSSRLNLRQIRWHVYFRLPEVKLGLNGFQCTTFDYKRQLSLFIVIHSYIYIQSHLYMLVNDEICVNSSILRMEGHHYNTLFSHVKQSKNL